MHTESESAGKGSHESSGDHHLGDGHVGWTERSIIVR